MNSTCKKNDLTIINELRVGFDLEIDLEFNVLILICRKNSGMRSYQEKRKNRQKQSNFSLIFFIGIQ